METSPQETKVRSGGVSLIWVFTLMSISFVFGAFVGLHPAWLPISGVVSRTADSISPSDDSSQMLPSAIMRRAATTNMTQATQPTTQGN